MIKKNDVKKYPIFTNKTSPSTVEKIATAKPSPMHVVSVVAARAPANIVKRASVKKGETHRFY